MILLKYVSRRPSGYLVVNGEPGVVEEADTLTCCHCGHIWAVKPGSGTSRGWCMRCQAPTCGRPECDVCVPYERRLEAAEARHRLHAAMSREFER